MNAGPFLTSKIRPGAPQKEIEAFVRQKYVKRKWVRPACKDPVSLYKEFASQGICKQITINEISQ
jgi:hypothetical protein